MVRRCPLLALAVLAASFATAALAGDAAAGKAVFDAAKPACKSCHTDAKNPLPQAGAEHRADEPKAGARPPKDRIARKPRMGIMPASAAETGSAADLASLVAYLATLK